VPGLLSAALYPCPNFLSCLHIRNIFVSFFRLRSTRQNISLEAPVLCRPYNYVRSSFFPNLCTSQSSLLRCGNLFFDAVELVLICIPCRYLYRCKALKSCTLHHCGNTRWPKRLVGRLLRLSACWSMFTHCFESIASRIAERAPIQPCIYS